MAESRRMSRRELDEMFARETAEEERKRRKRILGADGKPMNRRKEIGASKQVMEQVIASKLYKDGFVTKADDGVYHVDLTSRIEDTYEDASTVADVREILRRLISGLRATGHTVEVKRIEGSE